MLAYRNRPDLKDAVLVQLAQHRAADKLIHHEYWKDGRGCAVGCTLESLAVIEGVKGINHADHALYERYLGVPVMLARLEDALFESLPKAQAQLWPERFALAIRPGADLSMVGPKFLLDLLSNPNGAVQKRAAQRPKIQPSIQTVIGLYGRWIAGTKPSATEWREARQTAAADAAADAAERVRQEDALIALIEAC